MEPQLGLHDLLHVFSFLEARDLLCAAQVDKCVQSSCRVDLHWVPVTEFTPKMDLEIPPLLECSGSSLLGPARKSLLCLCDDHGCLDMFLDSQLYDISPKTHKCSS